MKSEYMSKSIKDLILGYKEFQVSYFNENNSLYQKLSTDGQNPKAMVIACSDSRVDPAVVLNCQPGDLFVVRNVANLVPPYEEDNTYHGTSAALEFAICGLSVEHIIVFGHTQCGGIRSMIENPCVHQKSFLTKWMQLAKPAHHIIEDNYTELPNDQKINICSQYAIINSIKNLKTFPWIEERVKQNLLSIHGWVFDIKTGTIKAYDYEKHVFQPLMEQVQNAF